MKLQELAGLPLTEDVYLNEIKDDKRIPDKEVIDYVVYKGHSFGFVFRNGGKYYLTVQASKPQDGGLPLDKAPFLIDLKDASTATKKDFAKFRVMYSKNTVKYDVNQDKK